MNRTLKLLIAVVLAAGLAGLLIFAFIEGRAELARERERERPIKVPPRISRNQSGDLIVTIDRETQVRIGLKTEAVTKQTADLLKTKYGATVVIAFKNLDVIRNLVVVFHSSVVQFCPSLNFFIEFCMPGRHTKHMFQMSQ